MPTLDPLSLGRAAARLLGCGARPFILTDTPEMMAREGVKPEMEPWEDGLRADTGAGRFEWWYFDADLDDGTKLVVALYTKSLLSTKGALKPRVEITLSRPDGTVTKDWNDYGPEAFSARTDRCDVSIAGTVVSGDLETYVVKARGATLSADLTFRRVGPSWRSGAGKIYFDAALTAYMGWVVPIPHGTVEGTVTSPEGTRAVKGAGYHDHNWGNQPMEEVFDYWFWGRARAGGLTFLFFDAIGSKRWGGARVPLFMMANDVRIVMPAAARSSLTPSQFVADPTGGGRPYPLRLRVEAESPDARATLSFSDARVVERDDLLSDVLPAWLVPVARCLTNPWYYRFHAALTVTLVESGATREVAGAGVYELMRFGDAAALGD